ncbi:glycerol kinase GlpK [bacterium]|nr:glycerol kinase GlpK [bacterium]
MLNYILSMDQGTTSSRAIIFDKKGRIVSVAQKEFKQIFPKPGWVEHNPDEIFSTQVDVTKKAITKINIKYKNISAIGITNQRETVLVWDKNTGKPIYNAIVWQDKRTSNYCNKLKKLGKSDLIKEKTGLVIDSYFSATKVKWILDNVDGARKKAENGRLILGTIDTWLIWNLTNGEHHITDPSNASRTLLFNINEMNWDDELLELFKIPKQMLPKVKQSSEIFGYTSSIFSSTKVPIAGIAGDQQAALFGQMCTNKGMVKNTYGTGCFMLMNIGLKPIISKNNLLTTIAWKINGKTEYALEGSIFIAGAVVQWLRDSLKIIKTSQNVEKLASSVKSSEGVYLIPSFVGLGAPYWNQSARGTIFGLTRGSTDAHIARAAIESIAFQTLDVLKAMESDSGIAINQLRVDGGASVNNMLMQFQSDVLNKPIIRPKIIETTAMGVAFLAGLAVNFWKSTEEIQENWQSETTFTPTKSRGKIDKGIEGWYKAIKALEYWTNI